ncbi:hypothetical protein E2C01_049667 [Portunus trituberculatus]|uniref:Uncharacterized protein n=1 Tax=Portunus trituberculatus TaxID=210409 RepID=A0A5B7GEH7_PORTR|nr:hypothetical protein [Portunus trituberculatus]
MLVVVVVVKEALGGEGQVYFYPAVADLSLAALPVACSSHGRAEASWGELRPPEVTYCLQTTKTFPTKGQSAFFLLFLFSSSTFSSFSSSSRVSFLPLSSFNSSR